MNENNINKLTENKENFLAYAKKIEDKFDGPSAYFYKRIIEEVNKAKGNYKSLFENDHFIEYLYATLACWGMHRMDKNTRMANYNEFKNSILNNKERFIKLSGKRLEKSDLETIKKEILEIFNSLKIMGRENAPKFVANSKIMHFLLPELIPPMDKGHIVYFFYGRINDKGKKYIPAIKDEEKKFWEILGLFKDITIKLDLSDEDLKNEWDTTIPKIIDNAIIGFNIGG